jgi:hypothetical protein
MAQGGEERARIERHWTEYDVLLRSEPELRFGGIEPTGSPHVPLDLLYGLGKRVFDQSVLIPFQTHLAGCEQCRRNRALYVGRGEANVPDRSNAEALEEREAGIAGRRRTLAVTEAGRRGFTWWVGAGIAAVATLSLMGNAWRLIHGSQVVEVIKSAAFRLIGRF